MTSKICTPSVIIVDRSEQFLTLFEKWHPCEHHKSFRSIKKQFSRQKPSLIVICINSKDDEDLCQKVTEFVRIGLSNMDTRIVIMRNPEFVIDEVLWMEKFQVNGCLLNNEKNQTINLSILNREIDTFLHIENNRILHDAETDMLMCITQFSKDNEPVNILLQNFSSTLSSLCYARCCLHIKVEDNTTGNITYHLPNNNELLTRYNQALNLPKLPNYLCSALDEKKPQINLLPENINLKPIEEELGFTIGSYLTFPISSYNKVLYLLLYFIPDTDMDKVSMKQINVINKACEQLTMLLERRQAETSLKKQYQRLKNTLIELKGTKEELKNQEKMASIGQMAAGIAHEINNPLSYVISNFSSMDRYLNSIMQLQDLQAEFLNSIDLKQDHHVHALKQSIHDFHEDQDISFVLEDIRAVVSDSHSGLTRVKNIISDLKSFTYSQSTDLEECHIEQVIEETLKILKYDIDESIKINKELSQLPEFMAHNGLMQQVITNLVKNAAQALTEAETKKPTIIINTSLKEDLIFISIKDNGPGIPEDVRSNIFEPFFTTKKVGEGTGLGLSVTFNIIKKLGGEIHLNSEVNHFTEFVISFPISNRSSDK